MIVGKMISGVRFWFVMFVNVQCELESNGLVRIKQKATIVHIKTQIRETYFALVMVWIISYLNGKCMYKNLSIVIIRIQIKSPKPANDSIILLSDNSLDMLELHQDRFSLSVKL